MKSTPQEQEEKTAKTKTATTNHPIVSPSTFLALEMILSGLAEALLSISVSDCFLAYSEL